jgi:hypothetical protein
VQGFSFSTLHLGSNERLGKAAGYFLLADLCSSWTVLRASSAKCELPPWRVGTAPSLCNKYSSIVVSIMRQKLHTMASVWARIIVNHKRR